MLIEIRHGAISYGARTVLSDINFMIKNTEKIAVVGRNGCGKSKLINLKAGNLELDRRDKGAHPSLSRRSGLTAGYLRQEAFEDDSVTLEEEVKKAFQPILDTKARLDALLVQMETDATTDLIQEYVDLLARFEHMGGYEYEKEYELLLKHFGFSDADKQKPLHAFSGG